MPPLPGKKTLGCPQPGCECGISLVCPGWLLSIGVRVLKPPCALLQLLYPRYSWTVVLTCHLLLLVSYTLNRYCLGPVLRLFMTMPLPASSPCMILGPCALAIIMKSLSGCACIKVSGSVSLFTPLMIVMLTVRSSETHGDYCPFCWHHSTW